MVVAREPNRDRLNVPPIDPDCSMRELATWLQTCAKLGEGIFATHKEWPSLREELLDASIEIAHCEGQFLGGMQTLHAFSNEPSLFFPVKRRMAELSLVYEEARLEIIRGVAGKVLKATLIFHGLPQNGRPKKLSTDYDDPSITAEERYSYAIAVELVLEKRQSGKFRGLSKKVDDAIATGILSDSGEAEQRIKRWAQRLWEHDRLYLPDPILVLLQTAAERVTKARDFMTSYD